MNWHELVDIAFCGRLCVTLLHSLWQCAVLVILVRIIDRVWPFRSVEHSYLLHVAALILGLIALPVTYALIPTVQPAIAVVDDTVIAAAPIPSETAIPIATPLTLPPPTVTVQPPEIHTKHQHHQQVKENPCLIVLHDPHDRADEQKTVKHSCHRDKLSCGQHTQLRRWAKDPEIHHVGAHKQYLKTVKPNRGDGLLVKPTIQCRQNRRHQEQSQPAQQYLGR